MDTAPSSEVTGTMALKLQVTVPRQRLSDLLCSAVEGGTGYWASVSDLRRTENLDYIAVTFHEEDGSGKTKRITLEDLGRAIETCPKEYYHHVANFLRENDDAETANVFVQLAMFGEVVYG